MFLTDRQRRLRLPDTSRSGSVSHTEVRPRLELLEDRTVPSNLAVSVGAASFGLFSQTETVTVTGTNNAGTALGGQGGQQQTVLIKDGGQTQTVTLNSNGVGTATFTFNLLQELQNQTFGPHTVSASYTPTGNNVFSVPYSTYSSATTTNFTAPGNTTAFFFQLIIDDAILTSLTSG